MKKSIFSILFSTRLMAFLFVFFAVAMAAGTFIEDAYNTDTARQIVYNAWWFEVIMVFFVINFAGNIVRYQLYKKEKWVTLLLHLSFIFILVGAFVTRYISFEGIMLIREGENSNIIYSDKAYLTAFVDGEYQGEMRRRSFEKDLYLAPVNKESNFLNIFSSNDFNIKGDFNNQKFKIEYQDFLLDPKQELQPNENGKLYLKIVESGGGSRHEHYIREGEVLSLHNILFAFNKFTPGAINISKVSESYTIQSPFEGNFMRMADQFKGTVQKEAMQPLLLRSLYNLGEAQFVIPEPAIKGNLVEKSGKDYKDKATDDALVVKVSVGNKSELVTLKGLKGKQGEPVSIKLGNLDFTLFYGSKVYTTPFNIKLDDFIADKYPGTEKSYSAFKSKLEVQDVTAKNFKDSVYMNHILDYRGYRFFQAGFDPDEKGTHLSVNHDAWGTWITYIGYFLLYFCLMAILIVKNTRFDDLRKRLEKIKEKKATLILFLFLGLSQFSFAQKTRFSNEKVLKMIQDEKISEEHSKKIGALLIQDNGRMKPINTFSSELLRKLSKKDTYEGMNSDQVFVSMNQYPQYWFQMPIIYLKRGNDSIRKTIGIATDKKYASLLDFFDKEGNYKLEKPVEEAYAVALPNQFQKDFVDIDQKISLFHSVLFGKNLKIYPIPNDKADKWISPIEITHTTGTALDSIRYAFPLYLEAAQKAIASKDYKLAESLLTGISSYQKKYGTKVIPSEQKIAIEIMYNKYDIFKRLFYLYMLASILMFGFVIYQIFSTKKWVGTTIQVFQYIIGFLFVLHTLGLIMRWYISGHAPWSDAYESMIYVAWATMFFGLALGIKSKLTLSSTTFVTSMILWVAHLNWMDPSIGNLQPVLNSYWLKIHVAVIVASYGPFAIGMILGLLALFLMIFTNESNKERMKLNIDEISIVNEMALTVGLVMLTIGNFLGGQWANESWGRYWGWDPKETWALISIMIYAFVIHARFVPSLRGKWIYNLMSVLAFASIVMTYVGVNFHLSGLHSYASGESQNVTYYFYILIGILVVAAIAYPKYRKYLKK